MLLVKIFLLAVVTIVSGAIILAVAETITQLRNS
jgi:hypothetical protein